MVKAHRHGFDNFLPLSKNQIFPYAFCAIVQFHVGTAREGGGGRFIIPFPMLEKRERVRGDADG